MSFQAKRITIVILVLLTIVLAGTSVYIGVKLQEDQAPRDSSADISQCTGDEVGEYCEAGECCDGHTFGYDCDFQGGSCTDRLNSACSGHYGWENCQDIDTPDCNDSSQHWCVTFECPNGDTDGDGQCKIFDSGATENNQAGHGCSEAACGQVDKFAGPRGNYGESILCGFTITPSFPGCGTTNPVCGNNVVEGGEQCDPPGSTCPNGEICTASCSCPAVAPACGDGNLDAGEECDDGNLVDGDGCNSNCAVEDEEYCGDGIINDGEMCDYLADPTGCLNTETCTTQCVCTSCGAPCDPDNPQCPVGHVCDSSTSLCVIPACEGNPDCLDNGCRLPETAIFNDSRDYVIYGLLLMLLGVFTVRYNILSSSFNIMGSIPEKYNAYKSNRIINKREKHREKQRDNFERKFEK